MVASLRGDEPTSFPACVVDWSGRHNNAMSDVPLSETMFESVIGLLTQRVKYLAGLRFSSLSYG